MAEHEESTAGQEWRANKTLERDGPRHRPEEPERSPIENQQSAPVRWHQVLLVLGHICLWAGVGGAGVAMSYSRDAPAWVCPVLIIGLVLALWGAYTCTFARMCQDAYLAAKEAVATNRRLEKAEETIGGLSEAFQGVPSDLKRVAESTEALRQALRPPGRKPEPSQRPPSASRKPSA